MQSDYEALLDEEDRSPQRRACGWWLPARRTYLVAAVVAAVVVVGLIVLIAVLSTSGSDEPSSPNACAALLAGGPMRVTADCIDPLYDRLVITSEVDLTVPVPHRMVSGRFEGTDKRFNVYLPPKGQWQGRFFQLVYPLQDENATNETISFGVDSMAYTVQTNGGGGYRVDAAAAKFSKTIAKRYYGPSGESKAINGYIYGGSGGSFQTFGAIENTVGVWAGAVPFIPGVPTSIPNNFFIRAFARFVLEAKAAQIADAVSPGGSGDPYAVGLNDVEKAVLLEVTNLGVPLRAWEDYQYTLGLHDQQGLLGFGGQVRAFDPTYADDFWSKTGYLGVERSALGDLFRGAKIDHIATVTQVIRSVQNGPTSLLLDSAPATRQPFDLDFTLYAVDGAWVGAILGSLNRTTNVFTISAGTLASVESAISVGAKLRIDNRWSLALLPYHRHQVPTRPGFYAWDQLRAPDGTPLYPQRSTEIGPIIARGASGGGTHTGKIQGKVIVVTNLLDVDAYPWDGDWYSTRVKESLGTRYDDNFRLWYNDNADHIGPRTPRLVQYEGILQQALRDLSAWAERGVAPARSTCYQVAHGSQIGVPGNATVRRGIQPVVNLTVNGSARIDVAAGRPVPPETAGKVVGAEWDFSGDGDFRASSPFGSPRPLVELSGVFTYTRPGTYFPALRATSQREGDASTPFARVQNLGRVRVVVHQ